MGTANSSCLDIAILRTKTLEKTTDKLEGATASLDRRRYKNPPIREALCEFQHEGYSSWDPSRIGRIYESIRNRFDATPIQEFIVETSLQIGSDRPTAPQPITVPALRSRFS